MRCGVTITALWFQAQLIFSSLVKLSNSNLWKVIILMWWVHPTDIYLTSPSLENQQVIKQPLKKCHTSKIQIRPKLGVGWSVSRCQVSLQRLPLQKPFFHFSTSPRSDTAILCIQILRKKLFYLIYKFSRQGWYWFLQKRTRLVGGADSSKWQVEDI